MNKIFCLARSHRGQDPKGKILVSEQLSDYLLYVLENRIGSNGGCCLTHVNMRCLGDFAETSWLRAGFEQMWVVEKANWNWRSIWQLGSVFTSRPQYERRKLTAAQFGNKIRDLFIFSSFSFFFSFFFVGSLAALYMSPDLENTIIFRVEKHSFRQFNGLGRKGEGVHLFLSVL